MTKLLLFFFLLSCCIYAQPEKVTEEWKKDKALSNSSYGFSVIDNQTGKVVIEHNSHLQLIPASTLKIFCTAAALSRLGRNYKYQTKIFYSGTLDKKTGVLDGDLIISGSGDPTLQSGYFSKESITDKWAAILKEKGLKEIKGKIIGDGSFFERSIPGSWLWEDISNYYGATPCGLNYMDNKFSIRLNSKEAGTAVNMAGTFPNYLNQPYDLSCAVTSRGSEDAAYVYGDPTAFRRSVNGTIPPNKINYEIEAALPDPALLCAEHLATSMIKLGIKCDPKKITSLYDKNYSIGDKQLLHTHFSPALDKIVYIVNQNSNNLFCESLLRTMGNGDMQRGVSISKDFCAKKGGDSSEVFMKDGSGLSRVNSCTASLQAFLLYKISQDSSLYADFNASLPVSGKNVSMSNIGKGTFLENNLRAKTGYLTRARAYCGYVTTKSGKQLSFSVMINNYNCSAKEAKLRLEKFMLSLSEL